MTKRRFWERAYLLACSLPTRGFLSSALASRTISGTPRAWSRRKSRDPPRGFLEVFAQGVEIGGFDGQGRPELDVGRRTAVREEAPTRCCD